MRHRRLILAAALFATGAHAADRRYAVGAFERIAVSGSPDVSVATGPAPSVVATGDPAMLDRLEVRVVGTELRIGVRSGSWTSWSSGDKLRVRVTTPRLAGASLAGSGDVDVDRVRATAFTARLTGSGDLRLRDVDVGDLRLELVGSGDVDAAGACGRGSFSIVGSGDLKAGGVRCDTLTASLGGSGNLSAYARRAADVGLSGSGDVRIDGRPQCRIRRAGSGTVTC